MINDFVFWPLRSATSCQSGEQTDGWPSGRTVGRNDGQTDTERQAVVLSLFLAAPFRLLVSLRSVVLRDDPSQRLLMLSGRVCFDARIPSQEMHLSLVLTKRQNQVSS